MRETSRYYGITTRTLNRRWKSGDLAEKKLVPTGKHLSSPILVLVKHLLHSADFWTSCKYSIHFGFRPVWSGN
jgi:hypothetical protein